MMQHASDGQWGRGLYFAQDAAYSHFYTSNGMVGHRNHVADPDLEPLRPDEHEMLQASLLLGHVVVMDRDAGREIQAAARALKVPPFLNSKPPLYEGGDGSEGKYDTVTGWTQTDKKLADGTWTKNPDSPRSKVFIVYENGRAYPGALLPVSRLR